MHKTSLKKFLASAVITCFISASNANELNVQVLGADNKAVGDVVVYAVAEDLQPIKPLPATLAKMATMDQQNKMFVPHVLAIPVGTKVDFPNTDTVNHYVYSFSEIKKFQFKLFKGDPEKHQTVFDKPGVVAIGCNIHDFMLGYIFVAPTPYVTTTNGMGEAHLALPDKGEFAIEVWYERSNEDLTKMVQKISINSNTTTSNNIKIHFTKPFKPQRKMSHDDDY